MGGFGDFGEGEGSERSNKANLGSKWVETEDEGRSSCEKLRAVLAVMLVVAVCQNTPLEKNQCKSTEHQKFGPPEYI